MKTCVHFLSLAALATLCVASNERTAKIWPFRIVSFPNDPCQGLTRNGTCYTEEECNNKGGSGSGSCASGYGVCCIITKGCNSVTSENCTYLEQTSTATLSSPCSYKVCPCSTSVCRIKYDFESFVIEGPFTGTVTNPQATGSTNGDAVGDCITDTFSIAAPGATGTPIICGDNTGQHMWVDVAGAACQNANFHLASGLSTRQWRIKVTQYDCGTEDISGPPGCLQYYTGDTGTIQSYNFPSGNTVGLSATHLSNQHYDICFRRNSLKCAICYWPSVTGNDFSNDATSTQNSFGLSNSNADDTTTNIRNQNCNTDYLVIPNAVPTSAIALDGNNHNAHRICGRIFCVNAVNCASTGTICSSQTPFRIGFNTDGGEAVDNTSNTASNELDRSPGGIVGFKLDYQQIDCP